MELPAKPARRFLARLLILGVIAFVVPFAYVVTIRGGGGCSGESCFFSSSDSLTVSAGGSAAYVRHTDGGVARDLWTSREWRRAVEFYSSSFQSLAAEGFISPASKALCVGSASGHEVLALKEIGVSNTVGISRTRSLPLVVSGNLYSQPFKNASFDFIFSVNHIEHSPRPVDLVAEISRTLKPEGFIAIHTASAGDAYSLRSILDLFPSCRLVRSHEIDGSISSMKLREIILQKQPGSEIDSGDSVHECSVVPDHKLRILASAEPLIQEEPLKPWITLKKNIKNVKYLPSMVDISFKRRYVYIDIGARSYGSSIGSWFKKQYPKQNRTFEIYAIEADRAFHEEYAKKKGVNLLPFAAWVRNETLTFEVNHELDQKAGKKSLGRGMGRIKPSAGDSANGLVSNDLHSIHGFDFAEWLKSTVSEKDFVVVKMDIEGTEFDLVPRLFETGAICLIDELFLECHYNRWQRCCPGERSPKYKNTYGQCLRLFSSLRESGVLVHQWW
ncbi:24-methylenesterol C-methyltransferase protein [Dioscorea alata]|uniref:24-methylenesterol C-methyltransferase protein n=1 Tax=Dioscorea alata TaxID=55571 RepID=A0ACB7V2Y9_DIOAL|nr:24-methylenesterol C-methyltransferase protein [Dioscorea alata]